MKHILLFVFSLFLVNSYVQAQASFELKPTLSLEQGQLSQKFRSYQTFELDYKAIYKHRQAHEDAFSLSLSLGQQFDKTFDLQAKEFRSDDFVRYEKGADGVKTVAKGATPTFVGHAQGQDYGSAVFTFDEQFVMASWQDGEQYYYLEPLWRLERGADRNIYVLYEQKDVIIPAGFCEETTSPLAREVEHSHHQHNGGARVGECLVVELALASDFEMFQFYGNATTIENFMLGVLANVQTNYDDEFDDELRYEVTATHIATSNATDPWTNNTDAGTLLNNFTDWGQAGGFGAASHDIATLWTARDFNGGTIGIAFVDAVCLNFSYNCVQDFSSSAALLRVVWAHEFGHNFSMTHDAPGSGFIMAPSVNNSTVWSNNSQNQINNLLPILNCLTPDCGGASPEVEADFSFDNEVGCAPLEVSFFDESIGEPHTWEWDLPGGSPDFSDEQNPVITYFDAGVFDVSMTAFNDENSDTEEKIGIVEVLPLPTADFEFFITGMDVDFINNSDNGEDYEWDFDDGQTFFGFEPVHSYDEAGTYTVTLTVFNECGEDTFSQEITIEEELQAIFTQDVQEGCQPLMVQFTDDSQGNPDEWEWEFPGSDTPISNEQNPLVTYTTAGVYNVSLTVFKNGESDIVFENELITVLPNPTAGFEVTTNSEGVVNFTNTSENATTYSWDFGDDNASEEASPVHTYTTAGTYVVTLVASNECGSDETELEIEVVLSPQASIDVGNAVGCAPLSVAYAAAPQAEGNTYAWTFEGGEPASSTLATPTVVYNTAGTYSATLTVTNAAGESTVTEEDLVVVNPTPTVGFEVTTNSEGVVSFNNTSENATTYSWNFGDDNTSEEANPTHTYTTAGTYVVTLLATNECGSEETEMEVEIIFAPNASIDAGNAVGCAPLSVAYAAFPQAEGNTYAWVFEGGEPASSTLANPTVVYNTAGTYSATLTVSNAAGESTVTEEDVVVVNPTPTVGFEITSNSEGVVSFNNTSENATTYSWNFGDDNTSEEANPTHTYTTAGTYVVTLLATNECGSEETEMEVEIIFAPNASIDAGNAVGCAPLSVAYAAFPQAEGNTYAWVFEGGEPASSTLANPTVVYNTAGMYSATLTVTNAAGESTVTEEDVVVVNPTPTVGFEITTNSEGVVSFNNTSENATTYSWNFGDDNTSEEANPTHTYTTAGTYVVTLVATNECGSEETEMEVEIIFAPNASIDAGNAVGCAPLSVAYAAFPQAEGNTYAWTFEGGEPASSTLANPTVVYNTAGTYSATLTVTNAAGESTVTEEDVVVVNPTPTVGFEITSNEEGVVSFNNTSENATTYQWLFGDNATSEEVNPTHTYSTPGTYVVTLMATNECGTDEVATEVEINITMPEVVILVPSTMLCAPEMLTFEASPIMEGNTYEWSFPGAIPAAATGENPTVTYSQAGVYTASLTLTNAQGESTTVTQDISVQESPVAVFDYTLEDLTASFTNNSEHAVSYEWQINGESIDDLNPTYVFPSVGTYNARLWVSNECGVDSSATDIVVEGQIPLINFNSTNSEGCAPLTVSFESDMQNADSFEWIFEGGTPATSTEAHPTVVYNQAGVYNVTLSATNAFGTNSLSQTEVVVVYDPASAGFEYTLEGTVVNFENTSTGAQSYEWIFPNEESMFVPNPSYTFAGNGSYEVMLVASNPCNSDTLVQTIDINGALPVVNISIDGEVICAPNTVVFTDVSSANPTSWEWTFEGATPASATEQTVEVNYTTAGVYDVSLVVANEFGSSQMVFEDAVTVIAAPAVADFETTDMNAGLFEFAAVESNANYTYHWDFGDNNEAEGATVEHSYTENGTYTVVLTVRNECGEVSISKDLEVMVTSVNAPAWARSLSVFPNPSKGDLHIQAQDWALSDEITLSLVNVLGQQMEQQRISVLNGQWSRSFNFSQLAAGSYMLQIKVGNEVWTQKWIKI